MSGFFQSLVNKGSDIERCRADALEMIHTCKEMYLVVQRALHEQKAPNIRARVKGMDRAVNLVQADVRRRVYRHLALSRERDLLSALQLHDIVNEIERVGDYSKNIAELAEMVPGEVDWGEYEAGMTAARGKVLEMFDLCSATVEKGDKDAARQCELLYQEVGRYCDDTLEVLMGPDHGDAAMVERRILSLVLMLRYTKRVAAHLKNAVVTITNPYHRLGYDGS